MKDIVRVQMLGDLSISNAGDCITDSQSRSRKVWALLAVLLCSHDRLVPQSELIELLWSGDKDSGNPVNSLKTTLHRARALLDQLAPNGGHTMLVSKNGGYGWNSDISLHLDVEEFEQECCIACTNDTDSALTHALRALELYRGPFLNKLSSESWVIPRSTYYHNLYLQVTHRALELLFAQGLWSQGEEVCRAALRQDPYQEGLYQQLMRCLLATGQREQVVSIYEEMSKLLLSNFGVMPDHESRRLYREALRSVNRHTVPLDVIQEQLRESDPITGALVCDYDFFKMIYQAEARMIARSGAAAHIVVVSLEGARGKSLARRSLDLAMDNLEGVMRAKLRKGDVISRCSPSQFLVMLPQANYENSCMVCERLERAFFRQFPHTPVSTTFVVFPLEPST